MLDDAHPRRAMRPNGLSRRLIEDLCAGFTARTGVASVSLRPVPVWDPAPYPADPWRVLADCSAAESILGWRPCYRWSGRL